MRYFNGRCTGLSGNWHGYICAATKKRAVELGKLAFRECFSMGELNNYWSEAWGNGITAAIGVPQEEGVWIMLYGDAKRTFRLVI